MNVSKFRFLYLYIFIISTFFVPNLIQTKALRATVNNLETLIKHANKIPKESFYILGPGDSLIIKVNENTAALNNIFTIDGEGAASLKRLDKIYVSGMTIKELEIVLNEKYKKFVKKPDVKLEVIKYRTIQVYVDGEVVDPGMHSLPGSFSTLNSYQTGSYIEEENFPKIFEENSFNRAIPETIENNYNEKNISLVQTPGFLFPTVFDALREGGGINENANLEEIIITRKNNISDGGGRIKAKINLLSAIDLSDPSQNIRIFDGDTILISKSEDKIPSKVNKILRSNINPKFINVFIGGQIENQSNFFKIGRNSSLLEAIEISGGTKIFKGPVKFIRYNSDGTYEKRKFNLSKKASKGSYKNPYLREGDIIIVGKGSLKIASEIINEITSPFRGLVTTYGLYEALTD
tara:strand:- start:4496 stop:5716 length:1221 start_codon:yes stop_codon:yes gene_type:complete